MIALGFDPGTARLGYGVIASDPEPRAIDYGIIATDAGLPMAQRLVEIHEAVTELIQVFRPDAVAVERLFFAQNVTTAMAVGQARGVILLAAAQRGLPVAEYAPSEVKQAVVGYGKADKRQIQEMVRRSPSSNVTRGSQPQRSRALLESAISRSTSLAAGRMRCGSCSTCRRVLEGLHPDVEVVAPEGNFIRKEAITEINLHAAYRPYAARAKVYVFLEAGSFTAEAANAFLKTLEEPTGHVHFILVTDHPERLLLTIASRCQPVAFSPVPTPALRNCLQIAGASSLRCPTRTQRRLQNLSLSGRRAARMSRS